MADIFISYTSRDRDWAFWIGHELEALGHSAHIHDWEISGGGNIAAWMEERHHRADRVVCVISEAYLEKPYSKLERQGGQWAAATTRPNFMLPVFVEPCEAPTLLAPLKRCDLHGLSEEDARACLRAFLAPAVKPPPGPFPGGVKASLSPPFGIPPTFPGKTALSNIPIRLPLHFMGRDDALGAIEMALKRYEGRVAITALHGLRGVGKTTLAAAYAERRRADYRATWWIRAQSETSMRADIVALGIRLGWIGADDKEEPAVDAVMERLRHEGEGILLIFDNAIDADALKPYLPRGGGAVVLVTSNARAWRGVADPVEIRLWPKETGAGYLVARTGRTHERAAAEALSEVLGGLPLAHEQAAAYCERLDISLAEYRRRFDLTPVRLLDDTRHAPTEYHDGRTAAKTFGLAIEEAAKLHPAAEPLIVHAALLAPEAIPLFLFSEAREKFGEPLATALTGDGLDEAVAVLRTFALIDREAIAGKHDAATTTDAIRLHRLVREVAAARHEGETLGKLRRAIVAALALVYPTDGFGNPASWPRCTVLTPHLLAICEAEMADTGVDAERANLLFWSGNFLHGRAAYSAARPLLERALAIWEKVHGPEHRDMAPRLNNLAVLLKDQGDLSAARPLFERALVVYEKEYGPEHPDTATAIDNLASLAQSRGDPAAARSLFERALAIREKALGPEHVATAFTLNNLGTLLQMYGDLAGAQPLYERALAIRKRALGEGHPETAVSINNLGFLLECQGALADAKPLYERAIALGEELLGAEHPDVATRYSNLARLLNKAGNARDAELLFLKAITIGEKAIGRNHIWTQRYASHYARLLLDTERPAQALPIAETALAIHATASGPSHPWTKDSAKVAADALSALGRAEEAMALRAKFEVSNDAKMKG
jgi:tetratricopeptide (TPR) repeat protein